MAEAGDAWVFLGLFCGLGGFLGTRQGYSLARFGEIHRGRGLSDYSGSVGSDECECCLMVACYISAN